MKIALFYFKVTTILRYIGVPRRNIYFPVRLMIKEMMNGEQTLLQILLSRISLLSLKEEDKFTLLHVPPLYKNHIIILVNYR